MRLRNMLKICLVFCKSEPRYAYKRYAYKKEHVVFSCMSYTTLIRIHLATKNYKKIKGNMMCEKRSSVYTSSGSSCGGWKGLTMDKCKQKCTRNEVPNNNCPHKKCAYIEYDNTKAMERICHLADETCKPTRARTPHFTIVKKQGVIDYKL